MANAAYLAPISTRPLPTNMRQHSTPQGRQFKPMDVSRNQDLVELWADMLTAAPPPPRWPTLPTSRLFQRGLYRRICVSIVPHTGVNLSLWTSIALITSRWSSQSCATLLHRCRRMADGVSFNTYCATLLHRCRRVADGVPFHTAPPRVFINRCRLLRQRKSGHEV
jgi:hypothetical protein